MSWERRNEEKIWRAKIGRRNAEELEHGSFGKFNSYEENVFSWTENIFRWKNEASEAGESQSESIVHEMA